MTPLYAWCRLTLLAQKIVSSQWGRVPVGRPAERRRDKGHRVAYSISLATWFCRDFASRLIIRLYTPTRITVRQQTGDRRTGNLGDTSPLRSCLPRRPDRWKRHRMWRQM